jgi:hypothetical protein
LEKGQDVCSSFSFSSSLFELVFKGQEEKKESRGFLRQALRQGDPTLSGKQ